jgi:hypothetical protein
MGIILALDLGKFKMVGCGYDGDSGEARFQTTVSNRTELRQLITREPVEFVVFEDLCRDVKVKAQVASTNAPHSVLAPRSALGSRARVAPFHTCPGRPWRWQVEPAS